ncbi:MAG: STAS domain-containing protein [Lentisphaerota bacterium]
MQVDTTKGEGRIQIRVRGDVDERGAEEMKASFRSLSLSGLREVVVDFGGVTHIGSAGIGKLLVFYKDLAIHGATLQVVNVPADIHLILCEMKLDTIFTVTKKAS